MIISYYRSLINVKAYLPEDKEVINIIKLCRLRNDDNNWKIWYDDFGNKLILSETRKIIIKEYDSFIVKDIHQKLHPKNIIKKSKLLLINKDNNIYYCLFYLDNHLKLSKYEDNIWQENLSPINIGVKNIRNLIQNANVGDYKDIDDNTMIVKLPSSGNIKDTRFNQVFESLGI